MLRGGRGASFGSKTQAIVVTADDGTRMEYRRHSSGVITDMAETEVKKIRITFP